MNTYEVRVTFDQDEVGLWLVHAETEEQAEQHTIEYVRPALQASALHLNFPEKVEELDYDGVLTAD